LSLSRIPCSKSCISLFSPSYMPHVLPISFISLLELYLMRSISPEGPHSAGSCYSLPLSPRSLPQHPTLGHHQPMSFP
jgi:hypothetical protein